MADDLVTGMDALQCDHHTDLYRSTDISLVSGMIPGLCSTVP